MIYTGDVLGLGHVRRNTTIAKRLVAELPDTNVLLLTSVPTANFFEPLRGIEFIKLPSVRKLPSGGFCSQALEIDGAGFWKLRTGVIESVARHYRPDLVLVDHLPAGVAGDLLPAVRALRNASRPPRIVLGLRDVLDDPAEIETRWHDAGIYRAIDELYDEVLIYGSREVFDTSSVYGLDTRVSTETSYCGYVCAADPPNAGAGPSQRIETQTSGASSPDWGHSDPPLIVVTAGGGADGFPMIAACVDALHVHGRRSRARALLITGPFMPRGERAALRARVEGLDAEVLWCVDESSSYLEQADLVMTMAGYNTLGEAVRLGRRTLVIPRPGPSAEQRIRAELFAARGLVTGVGTASSTPEELARLIGECLDSPPPLTRLPQRDGLENVVRRLCRHLDATGVTDVAQAAALVRA